MTARRRLDAELVRRKLADSPGEAARAIEAGAVLVSGATATKPGRLVSPDEPIVLAPAPRRYVSRGGLKLEAALDRFAVDVAGRRVLDAGCSTGGFTDCVLQRGATHVTAVDVGYGVLHERLRDDPRVSVLERTNVRDVVLDPPADVVVADLSYVRLETVAPALAGPANARPGADVVALVKPQYEAKAQGIVRDPSVWRLVLGDVRSAMHQARAAMIDVMVSPITGADGNVEFLAHLRTACDTGGVDDARLDAVVREAAER